MEERGLHKLLCHVTVGSRNDSILFGGRELGYEFKNKFSIKEAAKFLGITEQHLALLTMEGSIRQCQYKGERYYLGGELDVAKCMLKEAKHGCHETIRRRRIG